MLADLCRWLREELYGLLSAIVATIFDLHEVDVRHPASACMLVFGGTAALQGQRLVRRIRVIAARPYSMGLLSL